VSDGSITCVETGQKLSRLVPADIAEIFGNPPVLSFEDRQAYDHLMARLVLEWKPGNIAEWMFVRDIADISWEIRRHRRAITNVFAISFRDALAEVLTDVLPNSMPWVERSELSKVMADMWFEGPKQQKKVKSELMKYGLDPEAVVAHTYTVKAEVLDKMHRLLALAEARRTAITRNFNEYRAMSSFSEKPVVDSEEIALVPNSA
jgi:hypothetical protein